MKEIFIVIFIVIFLLLSISALLDEIKEQETKEDILNSLKPFMESFKNISSYAVFHYYDSRNIFGENGIDDTCVEIHYTYRNYSDSFILYFSDMKTMKREIMDHFANTVKDYDVFEYDRIHLENVKSESLKTDATSLYTETITGKIIYKDGTNIKEITKFISKRFSDVTNFKFYEESINSNRFNITGLKERDFEIERRIV